MSDLEKRVREFVADIWSKSHNGGPHGLNVANITNEPWLAADVESLIAMIRQPRELTDGEICQHFREAKAPFAHVSDRDVTAIARWAVVESYPDLAEKDAEIERLKAQLAETVMGNAAIRLSREDMYGIAADQCDDGNTPKDVVQWIRDGREHDLSSANIIDIVDALYEAIYPEARRATKEPTPEEIIAEARDAVRAYRPSGYLDCCEKIIDLAERLWKEKSDKPQKTQPVETWPQWFGYNNDSGPCSCYFLFRDENDPGSVYTKNGNNVGYSENRRWVTNNVPAILHRLPCEPEVVRLRREEKEVKS